MTDKPYSIRYEVLIEGQPDRVFELQLDSKTFQMLERRKPYELPLWTELEFAKCPNCPFAENERQHCPAAAQLSDLVEPFSAVSSITVAELRVTTPERTMSKKTTAQQALSSLVGLTMVTSGCPILAKLRPMARFHLPLATEQETVFRATGMYLISQFLKASRGETPDWSLKGLAEIYRQVGEVNRAFAKRVRAAEEQDANINALVLLDLFTQVMPAQVQDQLGAMRYLFEGLEEDTQG